MAEKANKKPTKKRPKEYKHTSSAFLSMKQSYINR